jgi:hypothetical protein
MVASAKFDARTVTTSILLNRKDGSFAIISSELPGLFLSGHDLQALIADTPAAIKTLYQLDCGEDVIVTPLASEESGETLGDQWASAPFKFVAVPVSAAA